MGDNEQACATKKYIHIYVSPKHRADSRARGSGQHFELGMSEKEGDQDPTSALGHSQGMGTQAAAPSTETDRTAGGLRRLFVTRLQEQFKPHGHYAGLRAVANCHDFTFTPGTAACECVIGHLTPV